MANLAIGAGWPTGRFIPPGCRSRHPLGLQGGQSNACGEGRKEPQSISELVALTDAGGGPGGRSGCPSPATCATSQLSPCPREGSALFSISGAFCPEEMAERSACCQSPGQVGRAGWRAGQESRACLHGVSFHAPFCAIKARDVRKALARKAVICKHDSLQAIPARCEGVKTPLVLNRQPHLSVPELSYQNTDRACLCSAQEMTRLQLAAVQRHCRSMRYVVRRGAGRGRDAQEQWDADSAQGAAVIKQ